MHITQNNFQSMMTNRTDNQTIEAIGERDFKTIYTLFIKEIGSETDDAELDLAQKFWNAAEEDNE